MTNNTYSRPKTECPYSPTGWAFESESQPGACSCDPSDPPAESECPIETARCFDPMQGPK